MTVKKPTLTPPEVKLLSAAFTGDTSSARQILGARQIRPDVADAVYIGAQSHTVLKTPLASHAFELVGTQRKFNSCPRAHLISLAAPCPARLRHVWLHAHAHSLDSRRSSMPRCTGTPRRRGHCWSMEQAFRPGAPAARPLSTMRATRASPMLFSCSRMHGGYRLSPRVPHVEQCDAERCEPPSHACGLSLTRSLMYRYVPSDPPFLPGAYTGAGAAAGCRREGQ